MEADLNRLITSVDLDLYYLSFLPILDRWGNLPFYALTALSFGALTLLPWLAKGQHVGPAVVLDPNCTGCSLCASECPYRAIEMITRQDESRFKTIATINEDLCTGCGICVGICATLGIEMKELPSADVFENGLLRRLRQELTSARQPPTIIFTCDRQATHGSVPQELLVDRPAGSGATKGLAVYPQTTASSPLYSGSWGGDNPHPANRVLTCVVPCMGMASVDWIKQLRTDGAGDVVLLGCPFDDCSYREGPHWVSARLRRRKAVHEPQVHVLEAAPGDSKPLIDLLNRRSNARPQLPAALPEFKERQIALPRLPLAALLLLGLTTLSAILLPLEITAGTRAAEQGQIRLLVGHPGKIMTALGGPAVDLPENASVDMAQILGGQRFPVLLEMWVDGELVVNQSYRPKGVRGEGEISAVEFYPLHPGLRQVDIRIKDDDGDWRTVYSDRIDIETAFVRTLIYDSKLDQFRLRDIEP